MDIKLFNKLYEADLFKSPSKDDLKVRQTELARRREESLKDIKSKIEIALDRLVRSFPTRYGEVKVKKFSASTKECRIALLIGSRSLDIFFFLETGAGEAYWDVLGATLDKVKVDFQRGGNWQQGDPTIDETSRIVRAVCAAIEKTNIKTKKLSRAAVGLFVDIQTAAKARDLEGIKDLIVEIEKEQASRG